LKKALTVFGIFLIIMIGVATAKDYWHFTTRGDLDKDGRKETVFVLSQDSNNLLSRHVPKYIVILDDQKNIIFKEPMRYSVDSNQYTPFYQGAHIDIINSPTSYVATPDSRPNEVKADYPLILIEISNCIGEFAGWQFDPKKGSYKCVIECD